MVTLLTNWDFFTINVINMINDTIFQNVAGSLDADGFGTATFNLPASSGATDLTMYFAYALNAPWDFDSNPFEIHIVM